MFYDVRIFDPHGKSIKIIHSQELSRRHWKNFWEMEGGKTFMTQGQQNVPGWHRKKLEMTDKGRNHG
jgi:hypothetical protein